ncbi:MAG: 23S rRNA (adenine(2503)-C(2))-methyltransferase RlmN [Myxococcota bacterium]
MPSLALAFEQPAPEPSGKPSGFALLPADIEALGHRRSAEVVFGRLQRPATWANGLPYLGRASALLEEHADLTLPQVKERHPSSDGSTKLILEAVDGRRFEAVHMPRQTRNPRTTLCLSSQVGCAMGCTFCATGTMGIVRNLSAGEIVGQVLVLMRELGPLEGQRINLVFMGMGEPLHNLAHVARAIRVLCHPAGLGLSERRITVSTSGLVPGIERLAALEVRPLLAVSVNATTDESRGAVMPVNRAFPLARLKAALARWPLRPKERITLEYVLLAGQNDTEEDAVRLVEFSRGLSCHVNLIPMNEHGASSFQRPADDAVLAFGNRLVEQGVLVTIRNSRGRDVGGACGQLLVQPLTSGV